MANTLLSSSSWFMRAPHLQKNISTERSFANDSTEIITFVPPEEEYSIRKYCPVTMNLVLPDLRFARTELIEDATAEFDAQLLTKFEKHLEESHPILSGSSTSRSADDDQYSDPDDPEETIEGEVESPNANFRKLLLPNKVDLDYPTEDTQLQLPDVELNNRRSSSPVFTKSFCTGCMNRNTLSASASKNKDKLERMNNTNAIGYCDKEKCRTAERFPSITDGSQGHMNDIKSSFTKNVLSKSEKKGNVMLDKEIKNQKRERASQFACGISSSQSGLDERHSLQSQLSVPPPQQRSRSTSPNVPPSPHALELVRLRRERLRLEERMLLKRRQLMEYDRLRPPADKWYEMKDTRFHQEARRHNIYLKNQNIMPLVEDRRKLLYDTITARL